MVAMVHPFVYETASAPGTTTTINLAGTIAGRVTWLSAFSTGAAVYYVLDDGTQAEWGIGSVTSGAPNTLSRTTVLLNTSGTTSRLNFVGTTRAYSVIPGDRIVALDSSGNVLLPGSLTVAAGGAAITGASSIVGALTVAGGAAITGASSIVGALTGVTNMWSKIATYSPSGAASQAIPLSTAFTRFRLTLQSIVVSTAVQNLTLQLSSDGGSTYLTDANYAYILNYTNNSGAVSGSASSSHTSFLLSLSLAANTTKQTYDGGYDLFPGSASAAAKIRGTSWQVSSDGAAYVALIGGEYLGTPALMNYCRVRVASGTLTGTIFLEGMVG